MCSVGLGMGRNDDCGDGGADSAAATVDGEDQAKIRPASQPTHLERGSAACSGASQTRPAASYAHSHPQRKAFFFRSAAAAVGGGPFKAKKIELWLERGRVLPPGRDTRRSGFKRPLAAAVLSGHRSLGLGSRPPLTPETPTQQHLDHVVAVDHQQGRRADLSVGALCASQRRIHAQRRPALVERIPGAGGHPAWHPRHHGQAQPGAQPRVLGHRVARLGPLYRARHAHTHRHKVCLGHVAGASESGRRAAALLRGVCRSRHEESLLHARDARARRDVRQGRRGARQGLISLPNDTQLRSFRHAHTMYQYPLTRKHSFYSLSSVHGRSTFLSAAGLRFGAMARHVGTFSGCSIHRKWRGNSSASSDAALRVFSHSARAAVSFSESCGSVILALPSAGVWSVTLCIDSRLALETYSRVAAESSDVWIAAMAACADCAIHGPLGHPNDVDDAPSTMSCITSGTGAGAEAGAEDDIARSCVKPEAKARGPAVPMEVTRPNTVLVRRTQNANARAKSVGEAEPKKVAAASTCVGELPRRLLKAHSLF
ncbi:hypothetical protein L1887_57693 [Cichorium endivia]|nr:hypothetical protein L1887_57693 [Cichorium endivia]